MNIAACVIPLPSAVAQPVLQVPRRGRFPKCVTTIREGRERSWRLQRIVELEDEIAKFERIANNFNDHAERARLDAADLRQKVSNLRALGRRRIERGRHGG